MHKFNINFRQSAGSRAATRAYIAFGHVKRMIPYFRKPIEIFKKYKDKLKFKITK